MSDLQQVAYFKCFKVYKIPLYTLDFKYPLSSPSPNFETNSEILGPHFLQNRIINHPLHNILFEKCFREDAEGRMICTA